MYVRAKPGSLPVSRDLEHDLAELGPGLETRVGSLNVLEREGRLDRYPDQATSHQRYDLALDETRGGCPFF